MNYLASRGKLDLGFGENKVLDFCWKFLEEIIARNI